MRRLALVVLLLGIVVIGIGVLFRLGVMFREYLDPGAALMVHAPQPQHLPTGTTATFHLTGSGFDRDTQVSLVMDVSNEDMVVHRYPLDGFFNTSLVIDDHLLLGSNDGLKLLSIADPESPRLLQTYLPGRSVVDLHYTDGFLVASCGRLGLVVMSLQDDQLVTKAEIWTGNTTTSSHVHQGYLYANTYAGGLLVYALSESMQVRQVGELSHDKIIRGMAFHEDQLFAYDRHGMLYVYDCSDPQQLRLVDQLRFESTVRSVLVKNATLFVALTDSIWIYNLTTPGLLDLVEVREGFGSIGRLIEGHHHIYVIDRGGGLRIFDSRDGSMTEQKAFAEGLQTLVEKGDLLYATGSLDGLMTIDRQYIRSRQAVTWVDGLVRVSEGLVNDDIFYLSSAGGAHVVEKNESSAQPFPNVSTRTVALARHHDLVFSAQATGGIKVYDVAIPNRPQLIAHWPEYSANRLQVMSDFLISSSLRTGLTVTDIADIRVAQVVEQVDAPQILAMASVDDYLFCVAYDQGLLSYRVNADGSLQHLNHMTPPFPAARFDQQVDIDVQDGLAYIANGRSGLLIVDVKNPAQPKVIGALGLPGYSKGVRFHQGLAYLVTLRDGIFIVDVTATDQPLLVGSLSLSRLISFLLVNDDLLYFFQGDNGMAAIPLPQFAQRRRLHSRNHLEVTMTTPLYPGRYSLQVSNRKGLVSHHAVYEFY